MIEVYHNLFVGNATDCQNNNNIAKVHCCKTCHMIGVGYRGSLPSTHPNYLILEHENNLYLNLVDMNTIVPQFTDLPISRAIDFIRRNLSSNRQVLIHCDQGQSRSCSITLVYLAKNNLIPNNSYNDALTHFRTLYPEVNIGVGFNNYLNNNWTRLMRI